MYLLWKIGEIKLNDSFWNFIGFFLQIEDFFLQIALEEKIYQIWETTKTLCEV